MQIHIRIKTIKLFLILQIENYLIVKVTRYKRRKASIRHTIHIHLITTCVSNEAPVLKFMKTKCCYC